MWMMEDEEMIVTQRYHPAWHTSVPDDRTDNTHNGGKIIYSDFIWGFFLVPISTNNTQTCIVRRIVGNLGTFIMYDFEMINIIKYKLVYTYSKFFKTT